MIFLDIFLLTASYWLAFVLRLDSWNFSEYQAIFFKTIPVLLCVHMPIFLLTGMYQQVWRYSNLNTALLVGKTLCISGLTFYAFSSLIFAAEKPLPRSIPVIFALLSIFCLIGIRFSWRHWVQYRASSVTKNKERCLIYGAGDLGEILARHIQTNPNFKFHAVGFIDDDRNKLGRLIHGLKIIGSGNDLRSLASKARASTAIIAVQNASGKIVRTMVEQCQEAGIRPLILPDMASSLSEDVFRPRDVDVKDLLRRSPKSTNVEMVKEWFSGHTVLVTGAGGSIGSEICRQVSSMNLEKIILLDACEYNLYRIELEIKTLVDGAFEIIPVLGSVAEKRIVEQTMMLHKPTCVLHAAAYKHVPLVESNPIEGILNNILGTKVVAEAAIKYGVENFLLISTDKAVRPTNIMGATKRCCELIIQAFQSSYRESCNFSAVRFGNVLGSSGSVIPRFLQQIQSGGPVTVTDPEVTRYFMLVSEAVALVLQSVCMAKGGEIFVLNMGEPVKILDMARQLILLAGKQVGRDIEISITGLRPGEKLYEELILEGSEQQTIHDDVFIAIPKPMNGQSLLAEVNALIEKARAHDVDGSRKLLEQIIDQEIGTPREPSESKTARKIEDLASMTF